MLYRVGKCNSLKLGMIFLRFLPEFRFFKADQGHSCGNPRSGLKILTIFKGGGGGGVNICWIDFNLVSDECFITKFH